MNQSLPVAYITNIPAPYRERMHELLAQHYDSEYIVMYCSAKEPNRQWTFRSGDYKKIFLSEKSNKMIHNNSSIFKYLKKYKPSIVISSGFNPTMLYAFAWCVLKGKKFIPYLDGTYDSEKSLSFVHRLVRKIIFRFSPVFVGTGKGTRQLYRSYNIPDEKMFDARLCIDNSRFTPESSLQKKYDLMFSGQLIERKMPLFFVDVAKRVKELKGDCRVLILGNGPLKEAMLEKLAAFNIDYDYPGFIQPDELACFYQQAKVFIFPTLNDPWGIVANEAFAAGVPVITCQAAGVANDLVIDGENGYVLPPDVEQWAQKSVELLSNDELYARLSANAISKVQEFNHSDSAKGIIAAIDFVVNKKG